jgi:hypothetical protein
MLNEQALEREGREALGRYFKESGVKARRVGAPLEPGRRPDAVFEVRLPSGERRLVVVEFKANARRTPIEDSIRQVRDYVKHLQAPGAVPLVFSWHFGRPMRDWLRGQGVWFADISGNRFFQAPGLLVDREVEGKTPEAREPAPSIFADRNSLVIRHLLPRPPQKVGVRALARRLGISPAAVSHATRKLQELGFLEKHAGELRILDREGLLEEWVAFYRSRFRNQRQDRLYVRAKSAESLVERIRSRDLAMEEGWAMSLHAGASLVAPFVQFREVHLYVPPEAEPLRVLLARALGAQKAEAEANLVFINPFYKSSYLVDARVIRGVRVVSDLQLYLDLMCFRQRGAEQAEVILDRRLRPSWSPT